MTGFRLPLVLLFLAPLATPARQAHVPVSFRPKSAWPLVSLHGKMTVARALRDLHRQTGIAVRDDRNDPDREVFLDLQRASFWQAVDALARASGSRAVPMGRDGLVALQRLTAADRRPPVSYDGPFRTRLLRIAVSRDLDSARAGCTVGLEVTWTPTLRPLFLETQAQEVRLRTDKGHAVSVTDEGSALAPVDGRSSLALDVALPALPRSESRIGLLEGKLLAVAPSKMLSFSFDADLQALQESPAGGAQRRSRQEDVICRIRKVVLARERWSIQIGLDYPEGNRKLESFQAGSLVANNELVLRGKDGKRTLAPSSYVIDQVSARRAVVTYHLTDRPGSPRGRPADYRLVYQAPARIVELPFHFSFRDVPLP